MKNRRIQFGSSVRIAAVAFASFCLLPAHVLKAADISLTADGAFAGTGGWSNGQAPTAGNNYFSSTYSVVTALVGADIVFAGDSLTLNGGFLNVRTGNSSVTVNDFRITNGTVRNLVDGVNPTILGNITLTGWGLFSPTGNSVQNRSMRINAAIGGTGELRVRTGTVFLNSANNTYSGGTLLQTDAGFATRLNVSRDGALGTGNVSVKSGSFLSLGGGTTHNYLGNTASLILENSLTPGSIALSFTGTDLIGGISFDNGTTWAAAGTWGAVGSGAMFEHSVFTGTGWLEVSAIPEPSTFALLMGGCAFLSVACRRVRPSSIS
ncbi:MAG: PEP-CTERM sorting domain-containing protein [Rariglobus sp.]